MHKFVALSALTLAGLLCAGWARAADKDAPMTDNDFLIKAVTCSAAEVKMSELAAKHASNEKVKEYAQRLVKEHKQLNDSLLTQAKGLKVGVVTGLEKDQQERINTLSKLKGVDFDREYLKTMVDAHEKAINLFNREAKEGKHDGVRDFAKTHVAALQKHLDEAKKLRDEVK